MAWSLNGKRVSFARKADRPGTFSSDGSYAEYIVTEAYNCIVLDNNATFQ